MDMRAATERRIACGCVLRIDRGSWWHRPAVQRCARHGMGRDRRRYRGNSIGDPDLLEGLVKIDAEKMVIGIRPGVWTSLVTVHAFCREAWLEAELMPFPFPWEPWAWPMTTENLMTLENGWSWADWLTSE